jgi:hypothetical protein
MNDEEREALIRSLELLRADRDRWKAAAGEYRRGAFANGDRLYDEALRGLEKPQ